MQGKRGGVDINMESSGRRLRLILISGGDDACWPRSHEKLRDSVTPSCPPRPLFYVPDRSEEERCCGTLFLSSHWQFSAAIRKIISVSCFSASDFLQRSCGFFFLLLLVFFNFRFASPAFLQQDFDLE